MADPDRTEDWLREGLAGAVPDPPGTPERAAAARGRARRARRRTTIMAAAGVVATLAVVGVVSTSLRDGSGRDETATAPTSPFDAPGCPEKPVDARTQVGPDHIPDGAVSVRLCSRDADSIYLPADALINHVDSVAAVVNGLPPADPKRVCSLELAAGYQLAFAYPDGSSVVAEGGLHGCREVVVNGVERVGADAPWERFRELLREQRASLDPPAEVDASEIDCASTARGPGTPSVDRPEDLVAAVVCYEFEYEQWSQVEIPDRDLELLVADLAGRPSGPRVMLSCAVVDAPARKVVGYSAWGGRIEFSTACESLATLPGATWSREVLDTLQRLSNEAARVR